LAVGIFKRGSAAKAIKFNGRSAIYVYLGEQLVWDGRLHKYLQPPVMSGSVAVREPIVRASAFVTVPSAARGYSEAVNPADMDAGATIAAPSLSVLVGAGESVASSDRVFVVPRITVQADVLPASGVSVSGAVINAALATGSVSSEVPSVSTGSKLSPPAAKVVGEALPAKAVGGWTVTAPTITGTADVTAPTYEIITFTDMQMNKTANQAIGGTYVRIHTMVADSAYPMTNVVNGETLVIFGYATNATIDVHAVGTKAANAYWVYFRVLVNGVMVGTEQIRSGTPNSFTFDFTIPGVTLNQGDVVELQARRTGTASISSGTYLRVTA
jgi:hypothetical protein